MDNIIIQNTVLEINSRGEKINEITTNRNNNEIKRKNRRDETKGK